MGCVQHAVLEFDEEVRAPWRPLLVSLPVPGPSPALPARRHPARPGSSRVGVCRPPLPAGPRPSAQGSGPGRAGGRARFTSPSPFSHPRAEGGRRVASRPRPRLRFTRRARRLGAALALCAGVVVGSWLGQLLPDGGEHGLRLAGVSSVVVEPGDTLWSLASSVAAGEDVRVVVDRIQELNGLEGAGLYPGQVLLLP